MSWAPGTIVVCVDAKGLSNPFSLSAPLHEGAYYTVRECFTHWSGKPGLRVVEIVDRDEPRGAGFHRWRFRLAESTHSEAGSVCQKEPVSL